jgi:hypothetical protein
MNNLFVSDHMTNKTNSSPARTIALIAVALALAFLASWYATTLPKSWSIPVRHADPNVPVGLADRFRVSITDDGLRIVNLSGHEAGRVLVRVNDKWEGKTPLAIGPGEDATIPHSLLLDSDGRRFNGVEYAVKSVWLKAEKAWSWQTYSVE